MRAGLPLLALAGFLALTATAQVFPHGGASSTSPSTVLSTVADAGTLTRADRDVYGNTFVASNLQPDGGTGRYFLLSNTDGCMKTGAGSSTDFCTENNTATLNYSDVIIPTAHIGQPACRTGQSCTWFSDAWSPGVFPRSPLPACAAGQLGGEFTLSTDRRMYFCDGSTAQRYGFTLSASASVDFASMADGAGTTATVTVTGAATTDAVTCSPLADPEAGLDVRYARVSAANTVTVAVRNNSGGVLDPASTSWKCVVIR